MLLGDWWRSDRQRANVALRGQLIDRPGFVEVHEHRPGHCLSAVDVHINERTQVLT